ncbi:hypothetical protein ACFJGV_14945 [Cnuibacter sp. UC19_7]|uniref:hypothetical protein n=1 Tax=Cnuibacter sp. UC19_7 TaxID=3350166 RepID=UPI00366F317F
MSRSRPLLHARRAFRARPFPAVALGALAFLSAAAIILVPVLSSSAATAALRTDLATSVAPGRLDFTAQTTGGFVPSAGAAAAEDAGAASGSSAASAASGSSAAGASGSAPSAAVEEVWGGLLGALDDLRAQQPEPLRSALGDPRAAVVFDPVPVGPLVPGTPTRASQLALSLAPSFETAVTTTSAPGPAASDGAVPVALSAPVAAEMGWTVGEERLLVLPPGGTLPVVLERTFEPLDPDADLWTHVQSALSPTLIQTGDGGTIAQGAGFVDAASWPALSAQPIPARTLTWFPVDPGRPVAADGPTLADQGRAFASIPHTLAPQGSDPAPLSVPIGLVTSLPNALDAADQRQTQADALLATALAGPGVVVVVLAGLLIGLLAAARAPARNLLAARGATTREARAALAGETAVAVGVGALLGGSAAWATAALTLPEPPVSPLSALAVMAFVVLLVATAALQAGAVPRSGGAGAGIGRLVAESLLVVLTAACVIALAQGTPAVPLRVLAPVLSAVVVGVVIARITGPAASALRRLGRGRAGASMLLGIRRPPAALVVGSIAALTITLFAATESATLRQSSLEQAWASVGADVVVEDAALTPDLVAAITSVAGIDASAGVVVDQPVTVTTGSSRQQTRLLVVDTAALAAVQAGRPAAIDLLVGLDRIGDDGTIPVLASASAADALGDAFALKGHGLRVDGVVPDRSALTTATSWILVDIGPAADLAGTSGVPDPLLLRVDPAVDVGAVADAVREVAPAGADVATPTAAADTALSSPRARMLDITLTASALASLLLAALLLLFVLLSARGRRRRRDAVLTALGARSAERMRVLLWEDVPVVVLVTAAAAASGVLLPLALVPLLQVTDGLESAGAGSGVTLDLATGAGALVAYVLAAAALLVIAVLTSLRRIRRPRRRR